MRIRDLSADDAPVIEHLAAILVAAFADHWPEAWPDLEAARTEVRASLSADRISRVALDEDGTVLGWIGGIAAYDGHVWELHPLVVHPAWQGRDIGRALVTDFEAQVRARGGLTIWLGTDDEDGMTSLAGHDLFPNVLDHLTRIRNLRRHPYEFYQKLGYVIVGALPDANGFGKPDIFMAKTVARQAPPGRAPTDAGS
ncbi:MAG: GNAT family N-acetyltransferase [Ktedonobacterales bacterium]|nr:GNAT family N-acetyltransferase [Ktedonobacterales bacterium]